VPLGHAQVRVDPSDVEAELAGVLGSEAVDLELDNDEAGLRPVEEQQVDVEVVAVDSKWYCRPTKAKPWPSSSRKACSRSTSAVSRSRSAAGLVRSRKSRT
jgi:hypothetical protein